MPDEMLLVDTLVKLADNLVDDFDVVELLSMLSDRCVKVLGVDAAGVMLVNPDGELRVVASSSDLMRHLELFELQSDEGPCVECFNSGNPVLNEDLAKMQRRWPRFADAALAVGFGRAHALPMRLRGSVIGALNLFGTSESTLADADIVAGRALADVATIAILQQRGVSESRTLIDQLNTALTSRVVIEQAKGVLAERAGLSVELAFDTLRAHARNNQLRLADVARGVVDRSLSPAALGLSATPGRDASPVTR